ELKQSDKNKLEKLTGRLAHVTDLDKQLSNPEKPLPFFLYRMHFHEVFVTKGGFDIVVANPPYVRGDILGKQKDELKLSFDDVFSGRADLYVYFFVRGIDLLRLNGQISYITSNKYLKAKYGEGIRKFLSSKVMLDAIVDFGDLEIFDVNAYPC